MVKPCSGAAIEVGTLQLFLKWFCTSNFCSSILLVDIRKIIQLQCIQPYKNAKSLYAVAVILVDEIVYPHHTGVRDAVRILAESFSFEVHKNSDDTQNILYTFSKAGSVFVYDQGDVMTPATTNAMSRILGVKGIPSSFQLKHYILVETIENIST